MQIIFSKNKSPLSRAIRWVLNEPCSHVAFVFGDTWLLQANLLGMNTHWFAQWLEKNDVVQELTYPMDKISEWLLLHQIADQYLDAKYDYSAFAYFAVRALAHKFFKIPMPTRCPWNNRQKYLCEEVVGIIPRQITKLPDGLDLAAITPFGMYNLLKGYQK